MIRRLFAIALLISPLAPAALAEEPAPSVTVSGQGEVSAAPDIALVTLGVRSKAKTAAGALEENSRQMRRVFNTLEGLGVAPRDIQTVSLSLTPIYRQVRVDERIERREDGFQAANIVRLRLRDLGAVGETLDALVGAGANELHGVSFDIAEKSALLDEARVAAIHDARRKAELYAGAAGVTLGGVLSIAERVQGGAYPRAEMAARSMDAGPPVAEGEQTISANVTVVFAIE